MARGSARLAITLTTLALPACGGDGAAAPLDAATAAGDGGFTFIPCTDDPRVDRYAAGLEKTGMAGALKVKLLASDPAPPAQGLDVWTVLVTDNAGVPQSQLALVAKPYMPDHRHAPPVAPVVTALPEPGQYRIERINLFMAGVWQVTINASSSASSMSAAGLSDAVVFRFCVER